MIQLYIILCETFLNDNSLLQLRIHMFCILSWSLFTSNIVSRHSVHGARRLNSSSTPILVKIIKLEHTQHNINRQSNSTISAIKRSTTHYYLIPKFGDPHKIISFHGKLFHSDLPHIHLRLAPIIKIYSVLKHKKKVTWEKIFPAECPDRLGNFFGKKRFTNIPTQYTPVPIRGGLLYFVRLTNEKVISVCLAMFGVWIVDRFEPKLTALLNGWWDCKNTAHQFWLFSNTNCYAELTDPKIKIDSLTNFWVIVNFVYFPCNLMTKYGHESCSIAISRSPAGIDDKIYISMKII